MGNRLCSSGGPRTSFPGSLVAVGDFSDPRVWYPGGSFSRSAAGLGVLDRDRLETDGLAVARESSDRLGEGALGVVIVGGAGAVLRPCPTSQQSAKASGRAPQSFYSRSRTPPAVGHIAEPGRRSGMPTRKRIRKATLEMQGFSIRAIIKVPLDPFVGQRKGHLPVKPKPFST